MARKRKLKQRQAVMLIAVLLAVLAVLSTVLGVILRQNREKQERLKAAEEEEWIPRSSYVFEGFFWENDRAFYEDEAYQSRTGIDVASHQKEIDWQQVAGDGVDYAVIQLGYRGYSDGVLYEDEQFRANLDGAKAAGLKVGVYFFSQALSADEAREEAEFVLELLEGETLDHPVFYDWERVEFDVARTDGLPGNVVTSCAKTFCETIEKGGYDAGVYFNQNYVYTLIDLAELTDYPLWLAQYNDAPDMIYEFGYWQYSDSGSVAGIDAPVDMNIQFVKKETE